jgi:hypothetical protein
LPLWGPHLNSLFALSPFNFLENSNKLFEISRKIAKNITVLPLKDIPTQWIYDIE